MKGLEDIILVCPREGCEYHKKGWNYTGRLDRHHASCPLCRTTVVIRFTTKKCEACGENRPVMFEDPADEKCGYCVLKEIA